MGENEYQNKIPVESIDFFRSHKNRKDLTYIAVGADSIVYKWSRPNETDKVLKYYSQGIITNKTELEIYTDLLNECSQKIKEKPIDSSIGPINFSIIPVEMVTSVVLPNHGECPVSVSPYIDGPLIHHIMISPSLYREPVSGVKPKKHILNLLEILEWDSRLRNTIHERLTQLDETLKEICDSKNVGCDEINTKLSYQKSQGYRLNLTDITSVVGSLVAVKKSQSYFTGDILHCD